MKIYHIGITSFELDSSKRELKSIGGIGSYISDVIGYLIKNDINVGFIGKVFNNKNIESIEYIETQKKVTTTISFLFSLFIKSIFLRLPNDAILHAHRADHLAPLLFFNNRKSIITLHGQQVRTINIRKNFIIRFIYSQLEKFSMKRADAILAVDIITKKLYCKKYPLLVNKIHICPTAIDTNIFYKQTITNDDRMKNRINIEDKVVFYVGRIEAPKRIDIILKSFKLLINKNINYKLIFIGDGVLKRKMEQVSKELGINNNVTFLGIRNRLELPFYYSLADVTILISDNEGSPLSIKESLACGTPVIANDVGDISEIINNSFNGYIVDKDNIEQISEKLFNVINISKDLADNCIESVKKYKPDIIFENLFNIYKEVSNDSK